MSLLVSLQYSYLCEFFNTTKSSPNHRSSRRQALKLNKSLILSFLHLTGELCPQTGIKHVRTKCKQPCSHITFWARSFHSPFPPVFPLVWLTLRSEYRSITPQLPVAGRSSLCHHEEHGTGVGQRELPSGLPTPSTLGCSSSSPTASYRPLSSSSKPFHAKGRPRWKQTMRARLQALGFLIIPWEGFNTDL